MTEQEWTPVSSATARPVATLTMEASTQHTSASLLKVGYSTLKLPNYTFWYTLHLAHFIEMNKTNSYNMILIIWKVLNTWTYSKY